MDWAANWIWVSGFERTPNFYMRARRSFDLSSDVRSAVLNITCSTEYKLYINGRYLGRGPNPCDPKWQYFDEYKLDDLLKKGENVICVLGYNYGVGTHCRPEAPGGLLFQLECTLKDGSKVTVASDENSLVIPADDWDFDSTQMFWTIGFQEVYDSRKEPVGWKEADFDDSNWRKPVIIGPHQTPPWENLVKRQIPMLREFDLKPVDFVKAGSITPVDGDGDVATTMAREGRVEDPDFACCLKLFSKAAGLVIDGSNKFVTLDFGREVIGFPKIKVRSSSGGTIDIGYSEALDKDGNVEPTRQSILQADRLILRGGSQDFRVFGRRAFRYMQLSFKDVSGEIEIDDISLDRVIYPAERVGAFECSDPVLNDIWETGVYTLSVCMQDQYEDCPLREHGQYPGDARVQALINSYVFGDTKLAAKALWQFVQNQRENGFFNALWPSSTDHGLPDYNLVWAMMLKDYHDYTVDSELLEKLYPNLVKLMDVWCPSQEGVNGLLTFELKPERAFHEWWLFIDHAPLDKRGEVASYNAFYYKALTDAWQLAARFHDFEAAKRWRDRAEKVKETINERLWDEKKGAYADCRVGTELSDTVSEQANYLAILFDVADERKTERILDYVDSGKPIVRSAGPYFNFYVLETLAKVGRYQQALEVIRREWGEMIDRGATTWWEALDPATPKGFVCPDSLCHAWGSAPTYWLMKHVAGIQLPDETSRRPYRQEPKLCDLKWVRAKLHEVEVERESS